MSTKSSLRSARTLCHSRPRPTGKKENLLLGILIAALMISIVGVSGKLIANRQAKQRIQALQERMEEPETEIIIIQLKADASGIAASAQPAPQMAAEGEFGSQNPDPDRESKEALIRREKLATLQSENGDLVGWIQLKDSQIDYPVMQSPDRVWYYLDHDFAGERSKSGLPFIDEACYLQGNWANLIIYGHNMKNGSMFGGLHKLTERDFYDSHRELSFDTPERTGTYRIASVFYMTVDDQADFQFYHYPNLDAQGDFDHYAQQVLSASIYPADTALNWGDELITLVTCSKHATDGRLVVVAKRV